MQLKNNNSVPQCVLCFSMCLTNDFCLVQFSTREQYISCKWLPIFRLVLAAILSWNKVQILHKAKTTEDQSVDASWRNALSMSMRFPGKYPLIFFLPSLVVWLNILMQHWVAVAKLKRAELFLFTPAFNCLALGLPEQSGAVVWCDNSRAVSMKPSVWPQSLLPRPLSPQPVSRTDLKSQRVGVMKSVRFGFGATVQIGVLKNRSV